MRSYPRVHTELCGESVPVSTGTGKRIIVVVTLFVATATSILGYAFWYWNQSREDLVVLNLRIEETRRQQLLLQQQLKASSEQIAEQNALIAEQKERLNGHEQVVDRQAEQVTAVVSEIQHVREEQKVLDEEVTSARAQLAAVPSEIVRSRIEYLLDIAETELRFRDDIEDAISLMEKALAVLHKEQLYPDVQMVLSEEIATLRAYDRPDEVSIRTELLAMADRVAELDIKSDTGMQADIASDAASGDWLTLVRDSLREVVTEKEPGLTASDNPYREDILRHELRLAFDDARFALLAKDPERFRATLSLSARLAERYFDIDETFIENIQELVQTDFEPDLNVDALTIRDKLPE
ncbi:MAG: uroporphyrinogen-III C-methyltransferase [Gammaproteobacteria bacterium]